MSSAIQQKTVRIVEEVVPGLNEKEIINVDNTENTNQSTANPIVKRDFHNSESFRKENAIAIRAALFPIDPLWDHKEWHVTTGERCIRKRMNCLNPTIKLYTSWFCPFAQRTWIALEECASVKYKWYEINPYNVNENNPGGYSKVALTIKEKQVKYPEFIKASPLGLIPAIEHNRRPIQTSTATNNDNDASIETVRLCESLICAEYINKVFGQNSLQPSDPYHDATVRIWCNFTEQRIQKYFYLALSLSNATSIDDKQRRLDYIEQCFINLRLLANAMSTDGPYFLGKQFTLFEIAFVPLYQRIIWLGPYYLKESFQLPVHEPEFQRLEQWWKVTMTRPSVYNTFVCKQRLIASYLDYTQPNKATSDYARNVLKN